MQDFLVASHTVSVDLTNDRRNTSYEFPNLGKGDQTSSPKYSTITPAFEYEITEFQTNKRTPEPASPPSVSPPAPPADYGPGPPSPPVLTPTTQPPRSVDPTVLRPGPISQQSLSQEEVQTKHETVVKDTTVSENKCPWRYQRFKFFKCSNL